MMKYIMILAATLSLAQQVFAAPVCPNINTIKSIYANASTVTFSEGAYVVAQVADYGTNNVWAFGIFDIHAANQADALAKAKQAIPTLTGAPAPVYLAQRNLWVCEYGVGYNYHSIAYTGFRTNVNTAETINSFAG